MQTRDLLSRCRYLLSGGLFDFAIEHSNRLLEFIDQRLAFLVARAKTDNSVTTSTEYQALINQYSSALVLRAQAYKELGHYDAAIADLDKHIQQRPESSKGYSLRGLVYALKGKDVSEQALADFLMCQKLRNRNTDTFYHVEELFSQFGKVKIFAAIQVLPGEMKIQLLENCLDETSYFGIQFRKQRGFNECSLEAGVLKKIHRYYTRIKSWTAAEWGFLAEKKEREGKFGAAVIAYSEALQIIDDEKLKVPLYFERGNMFFRLNQVQAALADYNLVLILDPHCVGAHINRAAILSVEASPEKLAAGMEAYEAIQQLLADGGMTLTGPESAILEQGIAAIFEMHGKRKVFEAIKCLDEDKQIVLLRKCLLEDHYLGAHFWKNRVPGTNCSLDKGTLAEIQCYLRRLEGQDEPAARPSVVDRFVRFFSPALSSDTDDGLEMQNTISI